MYDHQQIEPEISKHLFKGYILLFAFIAPPKNTLIRFDVVVYQLLIHHLQKLVIS